MKSISLDTSWIHNTGKMREELKRLHEELASLAPVGVSPFWAHWKVLDQKKKQGSWTNRAPRSSTSLVDAAHMRKCFKRWEQIWGALLRMNSSTKNLINGYLASHKVGKPHNSVSGYCKKSIFFPEKAFKCSKQHGCIYIKREGDDCQQSRFPKAHYVWRGE